MSWKYSPSFPPLSHLPGELTENEKILETSIPMS